MPKAAADRRILPICLVLIAGTFLAYHKVAGFDFVAYDDFDYVRDNPHVRSGLTWPGILWAFTTGHADNWHPLTWISHMLDCQIFGYHASGPHLVNLALHIANALLLFFLLKQMTGAVWRSAIVSGLFAWHPLHVESVAWIAERKDVLSTLFALLAAQAYIRYARDSARPESRAKVHYVLALIWFALGLMSKPMLVTLPFVFLPLDYWPLERGTKSGVGEKASASAKWTSLALEKAPFFLLSALSCALTLSVQRGAEATIYGLSMDRRLGNAVTGGALYLRKMVWPSDLAVFYPIPASRSVAEILGAVAILAILSGVAVAGARRRPWLLTGWLWFLGMLVPVIGIVQVGNQALADRYTYLPLVGIFIAGVWSFASLAKQWRLSEPVVILLSIAPLAACLVKTQIQTGYWRDTETLFHHDLAVTPDNATAHLTLGQALHEGGRFDEAVAEFRAALTLETNSAKAYNDLGLAYARAGNSGEALKDYEAALRIAPADSDANYNLGNLLAGRGDFAGAAEHYAASVQSNPEGADAYHNYGVVLLHLGKPADAVTAFDAAVKLNPGHAESYDQMAEARLRLQDVNAAAANFQEAIQLKPGFAHPRLRLGQLLAQNGKLDEAREQFERVIALEPANAEAHYNLSGVFEALGNYPAAITASREALRLKPNYPAALNGLAFMLAAGPKAELRSGAEAVQLAERAVQLAGAPNPVLLSTLDMAYAEAGQFNDAIKTAQQAQALAATAGQADVASNAAKRIELYRASQPFHQK